MENRVAEEEVERMMVMTTTTFSSSTSSVIFCHSKSHELDASRVDFNSSVRS